MERRKETELPYNYQLYDFHYENWCEFSVFVHSHCISTLLIDKPKENLKFHFGSDSGYIRYLNEADDGCEITWIIKELKQVTFRTQFGGNISEFFGAYNDSFIYCLQLWHKTVFGKDLEVPQIT